MFFFSKKSDAEFQIEDEIKVWNTWTEIDVQWRMMFQRSDGVLDLEQFWPDPPPISRSPTFKSSILKPLFQFSFHLSDMHPSWERNQHFSIDPPRIVRKVRMVAIFRSRGSQV
jgi:hypothetical protein